MSLKDLLPKVLPINNEKEAAEYFFALQVSENTVEAAVWGIRGNRLLLVNTAKAKYSTGSDPNSDGGKELIESANLALDEALATFQPEPTKLLFGVPDFWLQDEDLKPEYLKLLRKMVKHLDVEPMAFVSTTHALSNMLHKQMGVPPTVILVDLSDPLIVTVVKSGKIMGSKVLKRTEDLPKDIEKALLSFTEVEVLPSKIVIYGSEKADKLKEELVSFPWMSQLPFLHLPKIEVLEEGDTLKAVCFAGASELNPDVSYHFSKMSEADYLSHRSQKSPHQTAGTNFKENLESEGFVAGDIKAQHHERALATHTPRELQPTDDFYPVGEHHRKFKIPKFLAPLQNILSKLPLPQRLPKMTLLLPLIFLVLLVAAYIFLPKAKVTVFLDLRVLEKDAEVVADPNITAVDENAKKIPGKTVSTEVKGSTQGDATGKKKVGDSAKGKVIIYNATSKAVTIAKGTSLISDKNLKFILNSEVQIASKSASAADPPSKSGAVEAAAAEIGPEGNIPAGTDLKVGNYDKSEVVAKVDSAFSGGVSKDVTVVSSDDQKKLIAQLSSEHRKKAKENIQGQLTDGMKILEEGLAEEIVFQTFSKKVGEQASTFDLNLTARYKGTAYNDNDLKLIVSKLVETNVPEGYSLDLSQTETQADVSKIEKDGRLIFAAKFKAKLKPKINEQELKKQLTGKTPEEVAEIVRKIENVIGSNIEINPSLPGPLQRLPFLPQNITLEVTAK